MANIDSVGGVSLFVYISFMRKNGSRYPCLRKIKLNVEVFMSGVLTDSLINYLTEIQPERPTIQAAYNTQIAYGCSMRCSGSCSGGCDESCPGDCAGSCMGGCRYGGG